MMGMTGSRHEGRMAKAWCVLGLAALLLVSAAAHGEDVSISERRVSPWFIYKNAESIELLKPMADIIESVSVCGDAPAAFVAECHALGMEVYKLVGGKPSAYDIEESRKATIQGYLQLCKSHGYDGIDLDFEGQDASFRPAYSALMRDTSRELHAIDKKLSICVGYLMSTRHTVSETYMLEFCDPEVVAETCDIVRVMCYDMYSLSGKAAGPVSTQPWAKDAMKHWLRYIPRDRLVMGLPAYSGDFQMTVGGAKSRTYSDPKPTTLEGVAVQRVWLPYEQVNSYVYEDEDGHMHIYYASDAVSTRAHLETAEGLDLPRIGFWHFSAVTPEMWDVVRAWHDKKLGESETSRWLVFP